MNAFPTRIVAILMAALAHVSIPASDTAGVPLPASFDVNAIDRFLTAQMQQPGRVGLSVAIMKDGRLVLAKGYGKRSLADGKPVAADTVFAIGSVTKQFTCACVLLLAEEGRLSVKDPVAKYYPNLTRAKEITLLDLMNHVSGYPDYYPLDFVDRRMQKPIAEDELLRQYAGGRLDFDPGSKYSYSNTGYILLGRVVEQVTGESFGAFVTRRIFNPLGMTRTVYEPDASDGRLAKGYTTFALSDPEPIAPEGKGWVAAAGGIFSTPTDLAKWDLALMEGKVLKPESHALMTTSRELKDGRISDYGCGLALKSQGGRQVLSHNGAVSGFNASNAMIPSTRSAVVMFCNLEGGLGALPGQVFSLLLKETSIVPAVTGQPALEVIQTLFTSLQNGEMDRRKFSDEFNHFLTAEKIASASARLKPLGRPVKAEILSVNERGGMEVTVGRLTFKFGQFKTLMYRMPDGKVEQFFVSRE
jgi:CubicO group peptidase (beta-lactamase class C family)